MSKHAAQAVTAQPSGSGAAARRVCVVGIDEAGYGPRLGPLCVAMAGFELDLKVDETATGLDLWRLLGCAVGRTSRSARRGRIPVADSKKLKLPNDSRARHPLTFLELGVLSFLHASAPDATLPGDDESLLELLTTGLARLPAWYGSGTQKLPLGNEPALLRMRAQRLERACHRSGLIPLRPCCAVLDEARLNERMSRCGSKADVSFALVAGFLRRLWESKSDPDGAAPREVHVILDRQGGRTRYREVLTRAVPGASAEVISETPDTSEYRLSRSNADGGPGMRVTVQVEAEDRHLPVALASMTAKLTRELLMSRFNAFWCSRISELKPTAGYGSDASRWLRDVSEHLSPEERNRLVRRS